MTTTVMTHGTDIYVELGSIDDMIKAVAWDQNATALRTLAATEIEYEHVPTVAVLKDDDICQAYVDQVHTKNHVVDSVIIRFTDDRLMSIPATTYFAYVAAADVSWRIHELIIAVTDDGTGPDFQDLTHKDQLAMLFPE